MYPKRDDFHKYAILFVNVSYSITAALLLYSVKIYCSIPWYAFQCHYYFRLLIVVFLWFVLMLLSTGCQYNIASPELKTDIHPIVVLLLVGILFKHHRRHSNSVVSIKTTSNRCTTIAKRIISIGALLLRLEMLCAGGAAAASQPRWADALVAVVCRRRRCSFSTISPYFVPWWRPSDVR